jgi:class 3 adenylate cyclase
MIYNLLYVFLYCNIDVLVNKLYLSQFKDSFSNELVNNNVIFNHYIHYIAIFVLYIYAFHIALLLMNYKENNKHSLSLSLIYSKYLIDIVSNNEVKLYEHESSRNVMWLFATPLMIKMYSDANNMALMETNIHYHIVPALANVIVYPYKNTIFYYSVNTASFFPLFLFIKTLYKNRHKNFSNVYILIWCSFISIYLLDVAGLTNGHIISLCYFIADVIGKLTANIIVNDYNDKVIHYKYDIDLQCLEFKNYMIKTILKYKNDNVNITEKCGVLIEDVNKMLLDKIPTDEIVLKNELLKKILPLNLEQKYMKRIKSFSLDNEANAKQFKNVCVLFTDIVNYTDLSNKYSDVIIFNLLNAVYNSFDNIIKKYPSLQKIETIGDAYMVVGDIFSNSEKEFVVKDIFLFAFEIMNAIKSVKTPNNQPLDLRVGINIGNVSIGILGNEIPRMCVVGHTVNMTSRLQSTADVNSIQFSEDIYNIILSHKLFENDIEINKNENIFLKNIGHVTTFSIKNIFKNEQLKIT